MAEASGVQDQCGRGVGRGTGSLGTPISWVKPTEAKATLKWLGFQHHCSLQPHLPSSTQVPGSKHSDLGLNASSFLFSTPPTQVRLYSGREPGRAASALLGSENLWSLARRKKGKQR